MINDISADTWDAIASERHLFSFDITETAIRNQLGLGIKVVSHKGNKPKEGCRLSYAGRRWKIRSVREKANGIYQLVIELAYKAKNVERT